MTEEQKKNIVIIASLYMPHLGGVEKYTQSLAAELSKNCNVTVFSLNTEKTPAHVVEGEVNVYLLPCIPLFHSRFPVPLPKALSDISTYLDKHKPDLVIVQNRFYLLSPWACQFLHKRNIPFIQIEHGAGPLTFGNPVVDFFWNIYDKVLTDYEKPYSSEFYGVSQAAVDWLKHFGINGKGVLSNSIAPSDFTQALTSDVRWRDAHAIPADAVVIVFSGRVIENKGILDLLQAFEALQREDVHLVVAGSGDMQLVKPWQNRANIHFLGQVDFAEIPYILKDAQIFCLPSHYIEGQPTVILEAGYCGTAVVAVNNGGIPEVITNDKNGLLIPPYNTAALEHALRRLIDNPAERARLGSNLQQTVSQNFTWKVVADKILKL